MSPTNLASGSATGNTNSPSVTISNAPTSGTYTIGDAAITNGVTGGIGSTAGGGTGGATVGHENMPPYKVCYIWKRVG